VPIPNRYTGPLAPENKYGYQPAAEGDGINAATGNYTYSNADLTVPGRGIPITINRSYTLLTHHLSARSGMAGTSITIPRYLQMSMGTRLSYPGTAEGTSLPGRRDQLGLPMSHMPQNNL